MYLQSHFLCHTYHSNKANSALARMVHGYVLQVSIIKPLRSNDLQKFVAPPSFQRHYTAYQLLAYPRV
jgi:hypothetical protein